MRTQSSSSSYLQLQMTPLHLASAGGHTSVVSVLLDHSANTEAQDKVRIWLFPINTMKVETKVRGPSFVVTVALLPYVNH